MRVFSVPPRLAFVVPETGPLQVFLMHVPDGPPFVLTDTAAVIWVLAAEGERDVPEAVSRVVGVPREEIATEVENYVTDLVAKGLLRPLE